MWKNVFISLCALLILINIGCKKNCGCDHNGACVANKCVCPDPYSGNNCDTMCAPGYEGYMCATYSKNKFFGTWNCTSTDQSGNSINFLIIFSDYPSVHEFMYLTNFNNKSYVVPCTMTGKYEFQIQDSSTNKLFYLSGDGKLNNGTLAINMQENGVNYFAQATKQQ